MLGRGSSVLILGINLTTGLASTYVRAAKIFTRNYPVMWVHWVSPLGGAVIYERRYFFVFSASFLRVHIPSDWETMFKGRSRQKPGHEITQKRSGVRTTCIVVSG